MNRKLISIIIPAHNEENVIGKCLSSLIRQDFRKKYEIIVINDGSTDKTKEIVKKYPVKLINFNKGHSAAFARNGGSKIAVGDYLIFIDADQIVEKNFVRKISRFFSRNKVDGTDYLVFSYEPETIYQRAWSVYRKCNPSLGFPHIIKRKVFMKLNGFNEKIFYNEDNDLKERFLKNGYEFKDSIDAKVYHIEPETLNDFIRQRKWQAKGILSLIRYQKRWALLRFFIPCLFLPVTYITAILFLIYFFVYWLFYVNKTKEYINSFLWVLLDYIGRFISLFYFVLFYRNA